MRLLALLRKELADQRQNLTLFLPTVLVAITAMLIPLAVAVVIPYMTGERLSDSSDFQVAVETYRSVPETRRLDPEGAVQAYIFQYFLVMLMLIPVTSAMSVAAYSVVGEKQARSLEPLLATPITTIELLGAKVLGALIPSILLTTASLGLYLVLVAVLARPGVFWILLTPRSLMLVFLLGPLAALAALQMAVCVSSRVNDVRTAQQIGALIILPIAGLLLGQLFGTVELTVRVIAMIAMGLVILDAALMWVAASLFDRETILTQWK